MPVVNKRKTRLSNKVATAAAIAFSVAPLLAMTLAPAEAARRHAETDRSTVTGCSRFGNGCVTGPIRKAQFGFEVRMPGGTWISCKGDCSGTLRDETVDFWDTNKPDGVGFVSPR